MRKIVKLKEYIFLILTIISMIYLLPQYFESEFPLFIDLFTMPLFILFLILNIYSNIVILKHLVSNSIRAMLMILYSVASFLLLREVVNGNENITLIKLLFLVLQVSNLTLGIILKFSKFRGES